jgi:hypothetical protein
MTTGPPPYPSNYPQTAGLASAEGLGRARYSPQIPTNPSKPLTGRNPMYSSLPFTGFSALIYAAVGLGAVGFGALARFFGRKR